MVSLVSSRVIARHSQPSKRWLGIKPGAEEYWRSDRRYTPPTLFSGIFQKAADHQADNPGRYSVINVLRILACIQIYEVFTND